MIGTEFINIQGDPGILDQTCSVYCTEGKVDFSPDKTQLLLPSAALQVIVKAECKADLPAVAKTLPCTQTIFPQTCLMPQVIKN